MDSTTWLVKQAGKCPKGSAAVFSSHELFAKLQVRSVDATGKADSDADDTGRFEVEEGTPGVLSGMSFRKPSLGVGWQAGTAWRARVVQLGFP